MSLFVSTEASCVNSFLLPVLQVLTTKTTTDVAPV